MDYTRALKTMKSSGKWYSSSSPLFLDLHIIAEIFKGRFTLREWRALTWKERQVWKFYSTMKSIKEHMEIKELNKDKKQ